MAIVAAVGALATGCANYTKPQMPPAPQTPAARNFDALWQGSLEVLRKYRFEIDRLDRRAGVITTRKMLARHWFEFWRLDAISAEDLVEGTVQTVYRQATVRIVPAAGKEDRFAATVEVRVFRPRRLGQEIIAAGEAYDSFLDTANEDEYRRDRRRRRQAALERRTAASSVEKGVEKGVKEGVKKGVEKGVKDRRQDNLARRITEEIRVAADRRLSGGDKGGS